MVCLLAWSGSIQRSREVEGGRAILHGLLHGPDDQLGLGQRVEELQQVRRHLLRQNVAEPLQQRLGALVVVSGVSPEAGNGIVISILRICTFYSGNTLSSRWTPGEWCLYILIPWRSPSSPARSGQLRRGPAHGSRRLSCPWRCGTSNIVCRSLLQCQAKMTQQCLQIVDGVLVLVCMGITMMLI